MAELSRDEALARGYVAALRRNLGNDAHRLAGS